MSFPLGRPFGKPNDPNLQSDVLRHVFNLLERETGPVLEEYPFDIEDIEGEGSPLACPVDFSKRPELLSKSEVLKSALLNEIGTMQTWYEVACRQASQSTQSLTGLSNLTSIEIAELFVDFLDNKIEEEETGGHKLSDILRLAAEDIKAFYFKAVSVQPGQSTHPETLADWFWGETLAAAAINEVREMCLTKDVKDMQLVGKLLLVPRNQLHRFKK